MCADCSTGQEAAVKVAIADYGAGNLLSLCAALERAGAEPLVTQSAKAVRDAPLAFVAGVGHVASAAAGLAANRLDEALCERAEAGRPLLGICVGMQLLFEESEEGGAGLGLLRGPVIRLRARRVPHMGWNTIALERDSKLLAGLDRADVYFAHSYTARPDDGSAVAWVDHDGPVLAAVEQGPVAGVQFHPERSGGAGARALENALRWSRSA
jgi:imidazole glycerol-phosphate synthase subunit HisH